MQGSPSSHAAGFESLRDAIGSGMKRRRETFEDGIPREWSNATSHFPSALPPAPYYHTHHPQQTTHGAPNYGRTIPNMVRDSIMRMAQSSLGDLDSLCSVSDQLMLSCVLYHISLYSLVLQFQQALYLISNLMSSLLLRWTPKDSKTAN